LDHTLAEQRAAEALRDQAQAQLNSLDIMLADHQIRAPIDGVVARRMVDAGSLSDDKSPMFLISDESKLKVLTTVSERNYPLAKVGLKAEVGVDAYPNEKFQGRVEVVSPVIDRATRSAEMEIHLGNADRRLRSGMFARVRVVMGRRPAVLVPRSAVQRMPGTGTRYAFLAEQGRAKLVNVELGEPYGEQQEITKGLKPGQTVVVRGAGRLTDGMELAVAPAGEAAR
jgi:HlyD family secretion protein